MSDSFSKEEVVEQAESRPLSSWEYCMCLAEQLDLNDFPDGTEYEDIAEAIMFGDYDLLN